MSHLQEKLVRALIALTILTAVTLCGQNAANQNSKNTGLGSPAQIVLVNGIQKPVYKAGNGVTPPRLIDAPAPEFSKEARRQHIGGTVELAITVTSEGKVTRMRVLKSLGYGLDEKAIDAVRRWKFQPGSKDGKPVSVAIAVGVSFQLGGPE
jgi:TonB family protein